MLKLSDFENLNLPEELYENTIKVIIKQLRAVDPTITYGYGSSRLAIITKDNVIKIPYYFYSDYPKENGEYEFINYEHYCENEVLSYNEAKDKNLHKFFASVKYGGLINKTVPFYIYEKIELFENSFKRPSEQSKKKACNSLADVDSDWLGICYDYYDEHLVNDFLYFLDQQEINDLHSSNVGFRKDGSPCVCDYAGFS